jgi:hypothetical protein
MLDRVSRAVAAVKKRARVSAGKTNLWLAITMANTNGALIDPLRN